MEIFMRKKRKFRFPLKTLLLYIIILTSIVTGVTYSSYVTRTNASDSARVARPALAFSHASTAEVLSLGNGAMKPGDTYDIIVSVTNADATGTTEVAESYQFEITNTTDNLPLTFALYSGSYNTGTGAFSEDNQIENLSTSFNFTAGTAETHYYKIVVTWTDTSKSSDYAGLLDLIRVNVKWQQID